METVLAQPPLVSIGVPVYNGERGLRRCLDCLLAQDYPALEVIVSDNGSTDTTAAICAEYVRRDPRIRYVRSEENRGAIWNFNRVFELSSGTYFMWAAHDDEREPAFVSACVERLERSSDAVLCQVHTAVSIDGHEGLLYLARLDTLEDAVDVVTRYRETLRHFPATAIYGMYRSSAVRRTRLLQNTIASDLAFIQELSIHGRFVQVPRVLFNYRARRTWNTVQDDARAFLGVARKPWWYLPFVMLFLDHSRRLAGAPAPAWLKARLWATLAAHEATRLAVRLVVRTAGAICPDREKERVGRMMHAWWMGNPNLEVLDPDLFLQRVLKPQLGWWR